MGSDRARISYDERQQYRSVVMQQGRVTLEADWNESQAISAGESRKEALDFVGPAGTPDNGYAVSFPNSAFDFQVGAGTMYVGGMRSWLADPVQYGKQSEWLDSEIDPEFVPLPQQSPGNEFVYLQLREREISAVEDSDLKDVALGGPDTAQRTRLVQHILRLATDAKDCASALATAEARWTQLGLDFDSGTMRLNSLASLQVGFTSVGTTQSPCDPTAQGGYLGADNQLIRVQISSAGKRGNTGGAAGMSLLWGFDDASFLYRVDVIDPKTLKLQSSPVDAEHQPQAGQAVEILMAGAKLANGEFAAAASGFVTTLAGAYNPDSQTISLQDALPAVYGDGNPNNPHPERVFLRVWKSQLPFTPGSPVILGETGIEVTLSTANNAAFHVGDYWMFAVRPSTPQQVYPERYLAAPQPADGPRIWVCPLAVIQWGSGGSVLSDCRNPFDNLVDLTRKKPGGCCTVNISPGDLGPKRPLQSVLDQFRGAAGVNVCFSPGVYKLTQPLLLTVEHSNFNFEACSGGVVFQAAQGSENNFVQGMVILNRADSVTFRGIQFQMPLALYGTTNIAKPGVPQLSQVFFSVGLRPASCRGLTVVDCRFEYQPAPQAAQVAVGILAAGECLGLRLERNVFQMPRSLSSTGVPIIGGPGNFIAGFVLFPTTVSKDIQPTVAVKPGASGRVLPSFFHDAVVRDNVFDGLSLAVYVYADCGLAEFESNTVRNCLNGFWFLSMPVLALLEGLNQVTVRKTLAATAANLQRVWFTILLHPAVQLADATLRGFPLPDRFDLSKAIPVVLPKASMILKEIAPLQNFFEQAVAANATEKKTSKAKAGGVVKVGDLSSILVEHPIKAIVFKQFDVGILNQSYAQFERQAFLKPIARGIPVNLQFQDNDINTQIEGVSSGASLFVLSLGKDDRDSVTATGNTFVGANGTGPVSQVFGVSRCMHTGNMVLNEAARTGENVPISLWLVVRAVTSSVDGRSSVRAAAITGNVFRGVPILPQRTLNPKPPSPMDTWNFFNSET